MPPAFFAVFLMVSEPWYAIEKLMNRHKPRACLVGRRRALSGRRYTRSVTVGQFATVSALEKG